MDQMQARGGPWADQTEEPMAGRSPAQTLDGAVRSQVSGEYRVEGFPWGNQGASRRDALGQVLQEA